MNKPLTVMIIDGATWYSEDDWKALVAEKVELEGRIREAHWRVEHIARYCELADTREDAEAARKALEGGSDD